jgi:hypothetical protein
VAYFWYSRSAIVPWPSTFWANRYFSVFSEALRPLEDERADDPLLRRLELRELDVFCAITDSSLSALGLSAALGELLGGLLRTLADSGHPLPGALPNLLDRLAGSLADVTERLVGALTDLADGLAGTLTDLADALAGTLTDVLHRALCALADLLDGVTGLVEHVARAAAHVLDGLPDALQ